MSTLGQRIKDAREKKGLLQAELAKKIGVKSAAVISNWEKDINKPDAEKIVLLCRALDISLSYLFDYYGEANSPLSISEYEHIKKYRALDERGKAAVDSILNTEFDHINTQSIFIAARGDGGDNIQLTSEQREDLEDVLSSPETDDQTDL